MKKTPKIQKRISLSENQEQTTPQGKLSLEKEMIVQISAALMDKAVARPTTGTQGSRCCGWTRTDFCCWGTMDNGTTCHTNW